MRLGLSVAPTNRCIFFSRKAGLTLTLLRPSFVVIVHLPSRIQLFATPWTAARQASLSFTISQSLLKLMSIESMIPSNHLILRHPLLLLPSIFLSIRVFSHELAFHIRWPKDWSLGLFPSRAFPLNQHMRVGP